MRSKVIFVLIFTCAGVFFTSGAGFLFGSPKTNQRQLGDPVAKLDRERQRIFSRQASKNSNLVAKYFYKNGKFEDIAKEGTPEISPTTETQLSTQQETQVEESQFDSSLQGVPEEYRKFGKAEDVKRLYAELKARQEKQSKVSDTAISAPLILDNGESDPYKKFASNEQTGVSQVRQITSEERRESLAEYIEQTKPEGVIVSNKSSDVGVETNPYRKFAAE